VGGGPRSRYDSGVAKPGNLDLFDQVRQRAVSVGELTRALKAAVEPRFRDVWVAGEVTNLRKQASGHLYFSLKDDEAQIGAVIWASQARKVRFDLRDGIEVVARGYVEIYPPHGKYQLIVQELEPRGAGARALLLNQIKERLQDLPEGARIIYLKADDALPYSEVMKVMDLCREAGVEEVALIAEKKVQS